jgi:hypothetical protein
MPTKSFGKGLVLIPVILALACSTLTLKPAQADIEKEEQAIYSFLLADAGDVALILQDVSTNNPGQTKSELRSYFENISGETVNSFLERNAEPGQLAPDMQLGKEYILLTPDELSGISSQPNWGEVLKEMYPDSKGYRYFSRVGFSDHLDQALVYSGSVYGPLACNGDYYLFEKVNGEWLLKDTINIIIC